LRLGRGATGEQHGAGGEDDDPGHDRDVCGGKIAEMGQEDFSVAQIDSV
jgi:hypothetical protein